MNAAFCDRMRLLQILVTAFAVWKMKILNET